jgi:hypothetical protein
VEDCPFEKLFPALSRGLTSLVTRGKESRLPNYFPCLPSETQRVYQLLASWALGCSQDLTLTRFGLVDGLITRMPGVSSYKGSRFFSSSFGFKWVPVSRTLIKQRTSGARSYELSPGLFMACSAFIIMETCPRVCSCLLETKLDDLRLNSLVSAVIVSSKCDLGCLCRPSPRSETGKSMAFSPREAAPLNIQLNTESQLPGPVLPTYPNPVFNQVRTSPCFSHHCLRNRRVNGLGL